MAALQLLELKPGVWRLRVRQARRDAYRRHEGDRQSAQEAGEAFLRDVHDNGLPAPRRQRFLRRIQA